MKKVDLAEQGEIGEAVQRVFARFYDALEEELKPLGKYLFYLNFIFLPTEDEDSNLNVTIYTRPDIEAEADTDDYKAEIIKYLRILSQRLGDDPFVINSVLCNLQEKNEEHLTQHVEGLSKIERHSGVSTYN